jgi:hypothetical protein
MLSVSYIFLLAILRLYTYYDNDNDKPIKSLLKGKGLLPPAGQARFDS